MIKIVASQSEANCITHCGKMHADEVFATAFLELLKKEIKLCRTSSVDFENLKDDVIVYDIGLREFDHHQAEPKRRENGIVYSSFGLLWQRFGREYLQSNNILDVEEVFNIFDLELVEQVDAEDNGFFYKIEALYKVKSLCSIIEMFNPSYASGQTENEQFLKAVSFAKEIINETFLNIVGKIIAKKEAKEIIKNNMGPILLLDNYLPYQEALFEEDVNQEIKFVIFPSQRSNYTVRTVQKSIDDHSLRVPFPKEWGGLALDELEKVSGVNGSIFCHNKLFIAASDTKENAIKMAMKAIEIYNSKQG